jgi:hypothetical protein
MLQNLEVSAYLFEKRNGLIPTTEQNGKGDNKKTDY